MTRKVAIGILLSLSLGMTAGCGAEKPTPPRSLCGVKVPASAVAALLPEEGEEVDVEKMESDLAPHACSVYVNDRYYFSVLHDPERPDFSLSRLNYPPTSPNTYEGKLGIKPLKSISIAKCKEGSPPVYGMVSLSPQEANGLYNNSESKLEKFMTGYMPAVQKHYGCKTSR
jgi:hypothetical protein